MSSNYIPTPQGLRLLKQKIKEVYLRVNIMNKQMGVIDYFDGTLINDNYSLNVDSDVRRTFSFTLKVIEDYNILDISKKLWINNYLQIKFGIKDLITKEIVWYDFGIFAFDKATYIIDENNYTLQVSCLDLVSMLNGTFSGVIAGLGLKIPRKDGAHINTIREVMISTISQLGGFKKYNISSLMTEEIPHDLEFGVGANIWEIIVALRDLYPGWETFSI